MTEQQEKEIGDQRKEQPKTPKEIEEEIETEFKKIQFWPQRLKCNTAFKFVFPVYMGVIFVISYYVFGPIFLTYYVDRLLFLSDILMLVSFYFANYITQKIREGMQGLLNEEIRLLLVDEKNPDSVDHYRKYRSLVYTKLKSSSEFFISGVVGAVGFIIFATNGFSLDYHMWAGPGYAITVPESQVMFRFLANVLQGFSVGWWGLFVASLFFTIYLEFWLVNKLGYDNTKPKDKKSKKTKYDFSLEIDYIDLQMGSFDALGKFVLMTILPGIFLGTIMGIYGVATIFFIDQLAVGYSYVAMGIFLVILLTVLLYKNTTNIHQGIIDSKTEFKQKAYKDIQNLWEEGQKGENAEINYDRIKKITDFVQTIDSVSDWPFNPSSIKKLAVTVLTAVVPLILSFFGLNIAI